MSLKLTKCVYKPESTLTKLFKAMEDRLLNLIPVGLFF